MRCKLRLVPLASIRSLRAKTRRMTIQMQAEKGKNKTMENVYASAIAEIEEKEKQENFK
jgi:hypothetical protein